MLNNICRSPYVILFFIRNLEKLHIHKLSVTHGITLFVSAVKINDLLENKFFVLCYHNTANIIGSIII